MKVPILGMNLFNGSSATISDQVSKVGRRRFIKPISALLLLLGYLVVIAQPASANTFLTTAHATADTDSPNSLFSSCPSNMTLANGSTSPKNIYLEFSTVAEGNGLYPNSTISDAQLCLKFRSGGSYYGFASYIHVGVHELNNSINFNVSNITWNNQPCGTGFNNATNCNLTAENTQILQVTPMLAYDSVCWNVTQMTQKAINQTGVLRLALNPKDIGYLYYRAKFWSPCYENSTEWTTYWIPPNLRVTCGDIYEDFYQSGSCQTIYFTPISTTTVSSVEPTADYIDGLVAMLGESLGSNLSGGKLIIWLAVSILVACIPLYKKWTTGFEIPLVIFIGMFLTGVIVAWIPVWIGLTFMIIAGLVFASFFGKKFIGG